MKTQKLILLSLLLLLPLCGLSAKRALVVGISKYPQDKGELSWPIIHGANDVTIIKPILEKQGFAVTALINQKATATNIRKALATLVKKAQKSDIIYFHFSGHGQPVEDLSGDEVDGWDEAIIPYDALKRFKKGVYTGKNIFLTMKLAYMSTLSEEKSVRRAWCMSCSTLATWEAHRAPMTPTTRLCFAEEQTLGFPKPQSPLSPKSTPVPTCASPKKRIGATPASLKRAALTNPTMKQNSTAHTMGRSHTTFAVF